MLSVGTLLEKIYLPMIYSQIQQIDKKPVTERTIKDILSISDIKLILKMPNISKKAGIRDRFYIALLYDSGCGD